MPARRSRLTTVAVLGLVAAVSGGGLTAVGYLASNGGPAVNAGALPLHASAVSSLSGAGGPDGAATAMPGLAAAPTFALAPTPTTALSKKPATSKTARAESTPTPTPTPTATKTAPASSAPATHAPKAGSPGTPPATTAPAPSSAPTTPAAPGGTGNGGAAECSNPVFSTSTLYGTYTNVPYYVANDMWNVGSSNASQTLNVCSSSEWSVTANISGGGNSVKTYPNGQRDFANAPAISSLNSVTSTFAETTPGTGTYEDAYDIWLNAVANPGAGSDEVMIWNSNHGQIPGGSAQGTVTFGGMSYTVWKGNGNYFAFVANSNFTSGTLDLLQFFKYLMGKGWIPGNSTLVQVDYGVEVVATNGPETFNFSNFSVNAS
jgi:hypothetical protein